MANPPKMERLPAPIQHAMPPLRIAVYGEGGVGKTSFALSFPKPLVIDTDGGLEGGAIEGVEGAEEWTPEKFRDLNALYYWLKEQVEKKGYQTIVIDSIDTLARTILREAVALPNKNRPAGASDHELVGVEQADYGKVANAMDQFLAQLKLLSKTKNVHVIVTSGVREPDPDKGRTKRTFNVQPAVEDLLLYWSNTYGEMTVMEVKDKGEQRVLWTNVADRTRKCKTRFRALHPGISNPSFPRIRELIEASLGSNTNTAAKAQPKESK